MQYQIKHKVKVVNSSGDCTKAAVVDLVNEHKLSLLVNNKFVNEFNCLNENLDEIVIGWLIGNKYIYSLKDIKALGFNHDNSKCSVEIYDRLSDDIQDYSREEFNYKDEWIFSLVNSFLEGTKIHNLTSGTHCCILSINGNILLTMEDIGRHNAVDKVVGYIYKNNINIDDCIIFTSGRISSDLVSKIINAKIPILVSKSVTSYQAAKLACGKLRLICKAWPDSFEIYS